MEINWKGKQAAQKAVNTNRYRKVEKADLMQLLLIHDTIQETEKNYEYDYQLDSYIAKNIGKTNWKSFCLWGDRNKATNALILFWIKKDGISLDEQAMFMSEEYGHEILPDQLANFMAEHDRGCNTFEPLAKASELKKIFKELSGFNYDYRWVNEHLIEKPALLDNMPF